MHEKTEPCNSIEETKELDKVYHRLVADANDIYGIERRLEAFLHRVIGVELNSKEEVPGEDTTHQHFLYKAHNKLDEMNHKLEQIINHINRLEDIY